MKNLTEDFVNELSWGMSTPAAFQTASVLEFAIESFLARDSEGWREGVIDGLCRQLTKIAVTDLLERYWGYRGPFVNISEYQKAADDHFGIREEIKNVFFDGDCIDLAELHDRLVGFWREVKDWLVENYGMDLRIHMETVYDGD